MSKTVEVRVRPVVRYVVTRYESFRTPTGGGGGGCDTIGEFDNEANAELVAEALRHKEEQRARLAPTASEVEILTRRP